MEKNYRYLQLILLLSGSLSHGLTMSLDHYRDELGSRATMTKQAQDRVAHLRKQLGTEKYHFDPLSDAESVFRKFPKSSDAGSKVSVSVLYKTLLRSEISALREKEFRDKPPTFDPSSTLVEQEGFIENTRRRYCDANFTKVFVTLVNELSAIENRRKIAVPEALREEALALDNKRVALIQDYLTKYSPKAQGKSITDLIGSLAQVSFVDGHVNSLIFSRNAGGSIVKTPVSLPSLITFRTAFDKYFLIVQGCFLAYLQDRIDDKKPGTESKELLNAVLPIANGVFLGSLNVNASYAKLSKEQIGFLIDLMLQLRGNDIPVEGEMIPEVAATWDPKKNPSVLTYIESATARGDKHHNEIMMADYFYYRLIHRQLYELEDFLNEEKSRAETMKGLKR